MRPDRIPLFPLNVVLFPGAGLPLHIFEPRYRRMIHECVENKSEFGMLLAIPNGIAGTGCTAEILEVSRRYYDGRLDIVTVGRAPFRVVELFDDDPLLEGNVDYLEDRPSPIEVRIRRQLFELYETCHTIVFGDYPRDTQEESEIELSYLIADKLPLDLVWKQRILELRTETERQERLVAYLREWAPHLQKVEAVRRSEGGNGHGLN
ncbi:MAG TPA: LON peptidase substrate-binding domain-containing protein [Terriglobales bacterium]|nr:LON peptidase substrate-binding domain-containing protein [Terriglobales bacterium]